jgi:hypothetical protein
MAAASASAAAAGSAVPARTELQQSVLDAAQSAAAVIQRQLDAAGVQPVKPTAGADGTIESTERGVSWDKINQCWRTRMEVQGVSLFLVRSHHMAVCKAAYDAGVAAKGPAPISRKRGRPAPANGPAPISRKRGSPCEHVDQEWNATNSGVVGGRATPTG